VYLLQFVQVARLFGGQRLECQQSDLVVYASGDW